MRAKIISLLLCVALATPTVTINVAAAGISENMEETSFELEATVCTEKDSRMTYKRADASDYLDYDVYKKVTHGDWAQVTELINFVDKAGNYWVAYSNDSTLFLQKVLTKGEKITLRIKKELPLLGDVVCDDDGNFYVIWGENDTAGKGKKNTLVVSKYDSIGNLIQNTEFATMPDASLTSYAQTKEPFNAGSCDTVLANGVLVANFGRLMYNGHQSNGVIAVNTEDMSICDKYSNYASHSFDQRVIAKEDGSVIFANHGDAYPRGFACGQGREIYFHFYGVTGDNATYAQLGDICELEGDVYLAGSSAKSLTGGTRSKCLDLFMQIADDEKTLPNSEQRTGTSGGENVTDDGVVWITNYEGSVQARNPQMVKLNNNHCIILWEKFNDDNQYAETYYTVMNTDGEMVIPATSLGEERLNTFESPVLFGNQIIWSTAGHYERTVEQIPSGMIAAYKVVDGERAILHGIDVSDFIGENSMVTSIITPTVIPTEEPTMTPTVTPTEEPTMTPTVMPTPKPTATKKPAATKKPTATIKPTSTPRPTATEKPVATMKPTSTPGPTATEKPVATIKPTSAMTPTVTSAPQSTVTPTKKPTVIPTKKPSMVPNKRLSPKPTSTLKPSITPKFKKGDSFQTSKYVYEITNAKKKYVKIVKPSSKTIKSAKVNSKVKYKGTEFKIVSIDSKAFRKCKKLQSVTIGSNVSSISAYAFDHCSNLKKVKIESTKVKTIGKKAFRGIHKYAKISTPKKKKKTYKKLLKKSGLQNTVKIS